MNPRHSLTLKLTGVVLLISLLSVVLVAIFTRYATVSAFDRDQGELKKIAEPITGDIEFCTVAGESFDHPDKFKEISCPKCKDTQMKKVDFNIYTDIILDYCESCEGFWLDGGEYSRINDEIRHLNESSKTTPKPPMLWLAEFLWRLPF